MAKGVIIECEGDKGGFTSTTIPRQKKDDSFRTILNLKHLIYYVNYQHFKMESLNDVFKIIKKGVWIFLKIIKKGVWMASIDLKVFFFHSACTQIESIFFYV